MIEFSMLFSNLAFLAFLVNQGYAKITVKDLPSRHEYFELVAILVLSLINADEMLLFSRRAKSRTVKLYCQQTTAEN